MNKTSLWVSPWPPRFDQPLETIARNPWASTDSMIALVIRWGSSSTMLPNPMYTGGDPLVIKSWSSVGGVYCGGSQKKNPQTSIYVGQSAGFGTRAGDQQYVTGILRVSARLGPSNIATSSRSSARSVIYALETRTRRTKRKFSRLHRVSPLVDYIPQLLQVSQSTTPYER